MPRLMLLLLAVCAAQCGAGQDLLVEATPAWDGAVRAGTGSEIRLRLVSARGGELTLTATTAATRSDYSTVLEADVPHEFILPLPADRADLVQIEARVTGLPPVRHAVHLRYLPGDRPVVAVSGEIDGAWHPGVPVTALFPAAAALPGRDWSYALIDLLVMDAASLQSLSAAQAGALHAYLAACGRFIAYRVPAAVTALLRDSAGCSGRLLQEATGPAQLAGHLATLLEDSPAPLPSATELRTLLPEEDSAAWLQPLAGFFAGYFVLLLVTAYSRPASHYLAAIPVLAGLLGLYAWSGGWHDTRLVNWAEMEGGSQSARYAALLQTRSHGKGEARLQLPAALGPPAAAQAHARFGLTQAQGTTGQQLHFPVRLFSRDEFVLRGNLPAAVPLVLLATPGGPVIDNHGDADSPACLLAWHGDKFSVPPLAPGQRWVAPAQPEGWGNSGAERLFRERALRETAALLLPYSLADAGVLADDPQAHGYLMVRL